MPVWALNKGWNTERVTRFEVKADNVRKQNYGQKDVRKQNVTKGHAFSHQGFGMTVDNAVQMYWLHIQAGRW